VNHNYLPVSQRWVDWVKGHLDTGWDDPVVFDGKRGTASAELRRNLPAYQWLGVKYVVAPGGDNPFAGMAGPPPRRVFGDGAMSIYELADPRPYFESPSGLCTLEARDRTHLTAKCAGPETIVRRELFFPGWRATVNSADVRIGEHESLFQSIALPMGRSEVRFDYAPPHIGWAWLASFAALAAWIVPSVRRRLPSRRADHR
jgi:hypothetical protein